MSLVPKPFWDYDPKWGNTLDGQRVWIDWWLISPWLKSVYVSPNEDSE